MNLCDNLTIKFRLKNKSTYWSLEPKKEMFFTWTNLMQEDQTLEWTIDTPSLPEEKYSELELRKSGSTKTEFTLKKIPLISEDESNDSKSFVCLLLKIHPIAVICFTWNAQFLTLFFERVWSKNSFL